MAGSKRGRRTRKISDLEKKWVEYQVDNSVGPIEAAREVFNWTCDAGSPQYRKANNLKVATRVKAYFAEYKRKTQRELKAQEILLDTSDFQWDHLRQFIYKRLQEVRDDSNVPSGQRIKAIELLQKVADPSADVNLILRWVDLMWRSALAHCPSCHNTFPLRKIKNEHLDIWRKEHDIEDDSNVDNIFDRRMELLSRADNRREPHTGQVYLLSAPERYIAGLGAARGGKSYLLAQFTLLALVIPGVEVWVLAQTYKDAASEIEYLENFLNTLFYPYTRHVITKREDSKTEEVTIETKWGSSIKVKSSKSKGSITGRELELALIAEPGWVPDNIFNHLRARMSSRLGRIILLGTPQGFGGILGRFINMTGKDHTGKVIRIPPEKRTIASGCDWNISLLKYSMNPKDNPEYVKSELEAARAELTDAEYASEFQGLMASAEGALFAQIQPRHLVHIPREWYENAYWVLGVDQGPKNFGGCLIGFYNNKLLVSYEYFENTPRTIKANLQIIKSEILNNIRQLGSGPEKWLLTIFDADPLIFNELDEFDDEGIPWPTEVTYRPKNRIGKFNRENWRQETYEYINSLAIPKSPNILLDADNCSILHDQLLRVQARPENRDSEGSSGSTKGWVVNDPQRADHVLDAFVMAVYTILSDQFRIPSIEPKVGDPLLEAKRAFEFSIKRDEQRELTGLNKNAEEDLFEQTFGRRRSGVIPGMGSQSYYKDY